MNSTIFRVFVLIAALLTAASVSFAQSSKADAEFDKNMALMRKDLRSDKKQIIALNLPLTDTEATKFWPVYDQYTAEQAKIYDTRLALIKEYAANFAALTDATAASLNERSTAVDQSLVTLRLKYIPLVAKVLPGKKAALFFQLDKRLGLLIDLKLASDIPLVSQ
jgi:Spy/CpxP family protein refolding chaperone